MLTIGVERGVLHLELGVAAAEVNLPRLAVVRDDQRPALVLGRQAHDQRREHAGVFSESRCGAKKPPFS